MQSFSFYNPTEIAFGRDALDRVAGLTRQYGGSRVLLVYGGGSVVKSGLLAKAEALLETAGIACALFGGAQPNPLLSHAVEGVNKAVSFGADMILAVGGGSAIDTAKGIALGAANPEDGLWAMWIGEKPSKKALPLGVILTIPAAGSEMSDSAVLTNDDLCSKRGLSIPLFRPRFSIMNPEFCYTLPPYQVGCGATDIIMHTLERYFSPVLGNLLTDEIAEGLIRTVIRCGVGAVKNPSDYDAMSELMWCGSVSHNDLTGLGGVSDFSTHQLSHELSSRFGVAHGASLAAIWGSWARHCLGTNPARFAQYAKQVWNIQETDEQKAALAGIKATVDYFAALGMPTCFSEIESMGVQAEEGLVALTDGCLRGGERSAIGSFMRLSRNDIYEIYKDANR